MSDSVPDIVLIAISMLLGGIIAAGFTSGHYQRAAIEHNFAHYDQHTGKWQWNVEVKP